MSVLNPNAANGSLCFSDLDNQASFKTSTSSMGLSSGGFTGSKDFISNMGGGVPIVGGNSGDASSTTHAAISDGSITLRNTEKQQQNVADLSRDVEHANNALTPIFDQEKEQNRLREINLIGEIGNQVADIARTQGKIAEEKALKDPKAIQAAKEALAENGNLTPTNKQLVEQIRNTASASYGTGSDLQRAIQAATAITQGLTGGNIGQALAGGSAPYLAHEISKYLPADQSLGANLMAHAVLGAVVGHFSGNAAVGAVSAFTAEAAAPAIIKAMGWDKDSLTEKQKQTVSALATLAAGLAGGLVGDSSSSAVAGAQAGKNAVENNALSLLARGCAIAAPCRSKVAEQLLEIGAKAGIVGFAGAAVKDLADKMTSDELQHLVMLEMMGNDEITNKYLSSLQDKYAPDTGSTPNIGKDMTDEQKKEVGGSGSGTGTPPPPEYDPNKSEEKKVDKLNQKQESSIKKIDNAIKHALKDHDITGTLKDMDGTPVPKKDGGHWDHMQEMQNTLRGLRNHADTLKNVNNPEAQAAYGRATDAINKIESALKGHGI
ncbi:VENN motif pre-toxin domain-containing protein [Yersinia enterocolitica]